MRYSIKNYSFCKLYLSLTFLNKALTNQMDQLDWLYLRAQFLFLLQWFGTFGGLIPVRSGDLHHRTTTLFLPPKGARCGEGVKAQSHTILMVALVAEEVKGKN